MASIRQRLALVGGGGALATGLVVAILGGDLSLREAVLLAASVGLLVTLWLWVRVTWVLKPLFRLADRMPARPRQLPNDPELRSLVQGYEALWNQANDYMQRQEQLMEALTLEVMPQAEQLMAETRMLTLAHGHDPAMGMAARHSADLHERLQQLVWLVHVSQIGVNLRRTQVRLDELSHAAETRWNERLQGLRRLRVELPPPRVSPTAPWVLGNQPLLAAGLNQMVGFAVQHIEPKHDVRLRIYHEPDKWVLQLEPAYADVPPTEPTTAPQPLSARDASAIGLVLAHRIAQLHGGHLVREQPSPGVPAHIRMLLPKGS